jgi:hypothetical protein
MYTNTNIILSVGYKPVTYKRRQQYNIYQFQVLFKDAKKREFKGFIKYIHITLHSTHYNIKVSNLMS